MTTVAFYCSSSSTIGAGHLKRCLILAKALRDAGNDVFFIGQSLPGNLHAWIVRDGFRSASIGDPIECELTRLLSRQTVDLLIVDTYTLSLEDEQKIRKDISCPILIIDDRYLAHDCDVLLNPNLYALERTYRDDNLIEKTCRFLGGNRFILLDPRILNCRRDLRESGAVRLRVAICMGASDPSNATMKVIEAFKLASSSLFFELHIVTTSANPRVVDIDKYLDDWNEPKENRRLHLDIENMAALLANLDFAICSGSTTAVECAAIGLPTITIETADNQKDLIAWLEKNSWTMTIGSIAEHSPATIERAVVSFTPERRKRIAVILAAMRIEDGATNTVAALTKMGFISS